MAENLENEATVQPDGSAVGEESAATPENSGSALVRQVGKDGRSVYRLKNLIRVLSIATALVVLMLLCIYGATIIANYQESYPVKVGGESGSISICESIHMDAPTTHLAMPVTTKLDQMSGYTIPSNIDSLGGGSHNGETYLAYTFYARNNIKGDVRVHEKINIVSSARGADKALRVRVYRDGVSTTYAAMSTVGTPEYGTIPFSDDGMVVDQMTSLAEGQIIRYTIVIWIEGDDPECVEAIGGGSVRLSMEFLVSGS